MTTVSIIVPVYGAAAELRDCLRSVAAHTDLLRHELLLVLDGPQEAAVEDVVAQAPAQARVLRCPQRRGFVATVNHGMLETSGDVLLLNSDTVVTPNWLEQLIAAADSAPMIGTVTPLSNNGSLCSVPRTLVENLLPAGFDAARFAALVEQVSARDYLRIPTAVGFCMYIRRALLEQIGLFDALNFGLGYGEENDFCMRATAAGWTHVADDATFIQHLGQRSFRHERLELQCQGRQTLRRLHPNYDRLIGAFIKADPLATVRERIRLELQRVGRARSPAARAPQSTQVPRRIVHLLHGWPPFNIAGTELYASWLVQQQRTRHEVAVYARITESARAQGEALEFNDQGVRVRLLNNLFVQRNPLSRNALASRMLDRDFAVFLREQQPDLLHVHHLSGHAMSLPHVARRMGIPIVQQVHDWWGLCARVNLQDAAGQRCQGPALARCARCYPLTGIAPAPLWNRVLHGLRARAARRALALADAYVMGSQAIAADHQRAGLFAPGRPVHVLPYGVDIAAGRELRQPTVRPVRFGFIGAALPHKGLQIAQAAFAEVDPQLATLQVWGQAGQVFAEQDKAAVLAQIDVLLLPSVGLESFGLVAREAMARGVPVVAAADGALLELADAELFDSGDALSLRALILRLAADPAAIDAWSARLPPVQSAAAHALEIEQLYAAVLAARR